MLKLNKFLTHIRQLSTKLHELPQHRSLVVEKFGEPSENIKLKVQDPQLIQANELKPQDVLVEHLASPINPADINVAQGVYGIRPVLPAIIGNEGILRIKAVGSNVAEFEPGDHAVSVSLLGHWQNYSVQDSRTLYKVSKELEVTTAAQLKVNPCTAYRMLKDYVPLREGEIIIQNGANSAVGVYVIQLARLWGIKTINVIRDRPNKSEVVKELEDFGADYVLTEAEVSNVEVMVPLLKKTGKPRLFLNCIGGKNASDCQRSLGNKGYMITYGGMSKKPLTVSLTKHIFQDVTAKGFWVSQWYKDREPNKRSEISKMLDDVGDMFLKGILKPKASIQVSFEDRNIAFAGSNNRKYIFSINK